MISSCTIAGEFLPRISARLQLRFSKQDSAADGGRGSVTVESSTASAQEIKSEPDDPNAMDTSPTCVEVQEVHRYCADPRLSWL